MTRELEERAITSILASNYVEVLPYFRASYFQELFPATKVAMQWVEAYSDKVGDLPTPKEFKRKNPNILPARPQKPEPLVILMEELKDELTEDVVRDAAEKMSKAFKKQDMDAVKELSEDMNDKLTILKAPTEAQLLNTADHTKNIMAEMAAGNGMGKVIPSGFQTLDDELGGGWCGGRIYTISALIHLGKTYVTTQAATHAKTLGYRVLYVSLEMSGEDISEMSLCLKYKLDVNQYIKRAQPEASKKKNEPKEKWYSRILKQRQAMQDLDMTKGVMLIQGSEMGQNCAKNISALVKENNIDIVFIDAAQDIQANKRTSNKVADLYCALTELNIMVAKFNIPVVLTVQLSADVEKKGLKNNLVNIQWGQVFAQKSHMLVSMLGDRTSTVRECTIDKNRGGSCGRQFEIHMKFPEVEVYSTEQTSDVGIFADESKVFADPDDMLAVSTADEPFEPKTAPRTVPRRSGRTLDKKTVEIEVEVVEAPEAEPPEESTYQKDAEEKRRKRKLSSLKRKRGK